jgi:hypothetical protein
MMEKGGLIIYNTEDGKSSVTLTACDGNVWLSQQMLAELFDTSVSNVSRHITNILEDKELDANSVIEYYAITASDGKQYDTAFYSLDMILAVGFSGCSFE